jgi:hypothetical protein
MDLFIEEDLASSVAKFGIHTLFEGITTGSTAIRRRYAALFADISSEGTF